ncbi:MAG TPA: AMP-binding protein [Anaerolineae bacterium]|nr:AMP-binding protein [Anaerolineae bacterium]
MNSIGEALLETVSRTPEKAFLVFKDQEATYGEFLVTVNRIASGLLSLGVKKGDKVAILLPNRVEFPCAWLAANTIGAVMVPVNARFVDEEIRYVLEHSEASVLVTSDNHLETVERLKADLPHLHTFINVDERGTPGSVPFSALLDNPPELPAVDISPDDDAVILYTSGTTGTPKGCLASHEYFLDLGELQGQLFQLTSEDRVFTAQPFYYMDPQWNTIMVMLYNATLVVADRFSTSQFWHQVRDNKITCFYCIGSMTSFLYNMPPSELDKQHNLRMVQTSGIPPRIHRAWEERFGVPVHEIYASTETTADIAVTHDMDRKAGTACIGRPVPYREVRIVDDDDVDVPPGEVGEIILKRGRGMMKEYYKDPEATSWAFRGGWFHSGDLGYQDEDGDYHFVGRKKDIIRRGGENISAASVEQVLIDHPKILDAAVIPVPDPVRSEEVKAYIVPMPGEELTPEEVADFCKLHLAGFKVPRYLEFRDSLPKTPSERVRKEKLKEENADLTQGCYDRLAKEKEQGGAL